MPSATGVVQEAGVPLRPWISTRHSRQEPNATVQHGFAHSVAVIMAARAYGEGKKLYWDSAKEEILDRPLKVS